MNYSNSLLFFLLIFSTAYAAQTAVIVAQSEAQQKLEQAITFNPAATRDLIDAVRVNDVPRARQAIAQHANPNVLIPIPYQQACYFYLAIGLTLRNGWKKMFALLAHAPGIHLDVRLKDCVKEIEAVGGHLGDDLCANKNLLVIATSNLVAFSNNVSSREISRENQLEMVKILLEVGAWKYTKMFNAALIRLFIANGDFEVIRMLLHSGGDINGIRHEDGTIHHDSVPMYWAIELKDEDVMTILYSAGADIMMEDLDGEDRTLLDCALEHDTDSRLSIIKYLLYLGSQTPESFYAKIVSGETEHPVLSVQPQFIILLQVRAQKDKDQKIREISEQTLMESSLLTDQLSRLVGQYICMSAAEVKKEKRSAQQQKAMETDEKELACIQEERSVAAERAKKEKAATQHALVTLDFDDERKE